MWRIDTEVRVNTNERVPAADWRRAAIGLGGLLLAILVLAAPVPAAPGAWLHVDTKSGTLSVIRDGRTVANFPDISVGRGGVSAGRLRGDRATPLGEFRLVKVKEDSYFHRFFIIDYPNEERARLGLERGEIDEPTYQAISRAVRAGRLPPQDTPLGGNLGIHGIGRGDPQVHEAFNWTSGCIALTNEQVDQLTPWIRLGMRVVID